MASADISTTFDSPTQITDPASSRRLYQWGIAALVLTCFWLISENNWEVDAQTLLGMGILVLASRPALLWAKRNSAWFPAFEITMLTCIPFYAIPLLAHHRELRFYSESVVTQASLLVMLYIIVGSFSFSKLRKSVKPYPILVSTLISKTIYNFIPLGLFLSNIYLYLSRFTDLVPSEFRSILSALSLGIGTLGVFLSARLWGLHLASNSHKVFFTVNLFFQFIGLLEGLYLISGISIIGLTIISYSIARRSVPWVLVLIILPILSLLHLGKGQMRQVYWANKGTQIASERRELEDLPAFFGEWISYGLQSEKVERETYIRQGSILERASLMHMLCLSVDRVPREKPHLRGETYIDIPAALVPRILWKNKPNTLISTDRLAIYFNLVDPDNVDTSIAFGMLSESYINFGVIGVIGLAMITGLVLKRVAQLAQNAPQFSALGILSILLTAWSLQVEQTASVWISSIFQAAILCIGIPLAHRMLTAR